MTIDWRDMKFFSKDEFRPPGFTANFEMGLGFILKLENLRGQTGMPIRVHPNGGFAVSGHMDDSLHYQGLAADVHLCAPGSDHPADIVQQALLAYKWTLLSIGIYPFWHQPGLHLDDRTALGREKTVWFKDRQGLYHYYPYGRFHDCVRDVIVHMRPRN